MVEKQHEEKPEEVVLCCLSSLEMCKQCPRGSDVHIKNLRKSENESVGVCVCANCTTC